MRTHLLTLTLFSFLFSSRASVQAEILIRWDQSQVPSPQSLGISTLVVPAQDSDAVRSAFAQGYRLYLEVDASALSTFAPPTPALAGVIVTGTATPLALRQFRQRLVPRGIRVIAAETGGKWPHIRSNWVTRVPQGGPRATSQPSARTNDVLQVTGRSAQPWIENNAALLRIINASHPDSTPMLTYSWTPITLSEMDEGPRLENYLVGIAEAGTFGADLLLPLHARFQQRLLLGQPQARAEWDEIRRYLEFYSWNLPGRYRPMANIGVVTAKPTQWFEVMNLLMRHNLPFELIAPARLSKRALDRLRLLIVLDEPDRAQHDVLAEFSRTGGVFKVVNGPVDPNRFALEMRQLLGRDHRVIDIWNGITVLTSPRAEPNGTGALLTVLNYAHQPLPVQLRIAGTYAQVQYESPEEEATLLPHQHRDGYTEFVLPALRIGGRVFLTRLQ
jgi:hypothetical protein